MHIKKFILALFLLLPAVSAAAAELDPCRIGNPLYWGCLAAVRCNTQLAGGTYCGAHDFCQQLSDEKKVAENTAKILAARQVCKYVPPANLIPAKDSIAISQAIAGCATAVAGQDLQLQKQYCDGLKAYEKICPEPKFINICPDLPWLPKVPVIDLPDPEELANDVYDKFNSIMGGGSTHGGYTGENYDYVRKQTAFAVNGTLTAAAAGDFESVVKFAGDAMEASPPANMYLSGLNSALIKNKADIKLIQQNIRVALEDARQKIPPGKVAAVALAGGPNLELWQAMADANFQTNPAETVRSLVSQFHLQQKKPINMKFMSKGIAYDPALAKSLQGSHSGALGAMVIAEAMHANFKFRLKVGDTLKQGEALISKNGKYMLRLQRDCNLIWYGPGIYGGIAGWRKDWKGKICRLVQQGDGNLVLYLDNNKPLWSSRGASSVRDHYITALQDDGNLVTYDHNNKPLWNPGTQRCKNHVRYWDDIRTSRMLTETTGWDCN